MKNLRRSAPWVAFSVVLLAWGCSVDERSPGVSAQTNPLGGAGASSTGMDGTGAEIPEQPTPLELAPVNGGGAMGQAQGSPCTEEGASQACGPEREEGVCRFGTQSCSAGLWSECSGATLPGPRDCSSTEDNDCDGQPDDTLDDVCPCTPGTEQTCQEHDGLDGRGSCHAGQQICVLAPDQQTSEWGECTGSVGPEPADDCNVLGNDGNCDGTINGGCTCVEGQAAPCGPETDAGICQRGTSTCRGGSFGECEGAVYPGRRDCSSVQDNDCDGRPDNTIDATCTCVIGDVQACGTHAGRDGNGPCRAGQQTCEAGAGNVTSRFGACTGSVGPAARDACTRAGDDSDCSGTPNNGCQCIAGQGNAPCSSDANASRCDASGACVSCQVNADCSLISGGRTFCDAGRCTTAPVCGDGVRGGSEVCDGGRNGSTAVGACNPECNGFYEERTLQVTVGRYDGNLGGIRGADAICQGEFGGEYKALLTGGQRRATVTPFLGDGQQDWVLRKYTHYLRGSDGVVIWRTDGVPLLGASGGRKQALFVNLWAPNTGNYPWSGFGPDWTTFVPTAAGSLGTCEGWTSNVFTVDSSYGAFITDDLNQAANEPCSVPMALLCVEQ